MKIKHVNKTLAVIAGLFAGISILLALQLVPMTIANNNGVIGHHIMMGEHHMMEGVEEMEGCHKMMSNTHEMHEIMRGLSIEEMDKNGDGICDFCGMSVEHCKMMTGLEGD